MSNSESIPRIRTRHLIVQSNECSLRANLYHVSLGTLITRVVPFDHPSKLKAAFYWRP